MSINDAKPLNVCINGCSCTFGEGFPEEMRQDYIYSWLLARKFNFNVDNIAKPGSSNYTIFMRSASAILSGKYDICITQWSGINRQWFSPGPDTYFFVNDEKNKDFTYRNFYLSPREKSIFRKTLLVLNHDYQNIFELVDYCKILKGLADYKSVKLVYVDGLVPWQNDLATPFVGKDLANELSEYTKAILEFDTRDDAEIIKYFTKLQNKFKELDQSLWVNIFSSFKDNQVDKGPEGHHPGIKTHQWMADQIAEFLIRKYKL
jgi:hypothetical protein